MVQETRPGCWRLEIPAGPAGVYRLAELDDYLYAGRRDFPWQAPVRMTLRARVSSAEMPGTWGFGLWNKPFGAAQGIRGTARRLPVLPNAAWFFYAGLPNYLAFRDTHPANGLLAATFSSPLIPSLALAPGALALPLLALPPAAKVFRRAVPWLIGEDGATVPGDPTQWHEYSLEWREERVDFSIDERRFFTTAASPRGRQGLVIWIDNQYAAYPPDGKLRSGVSANPEPAWLEVEQLEMN